MKPDSFTGRTDEAIMSTRAHEMTHDWQWKETFENESD
jgi:hypothetical protein